MADRVEMRIDRASVAQTAAGVRRWGHEVLSKTEALAARMAVEMESFAKQNRTWKDQTAVARASLNGFMRKDGGDIVVGIAHGVDYGKYLELCHAGRYAILEPTVRHFASKFRSAVEIAVRTS